MTESIYTDRDALFRNLNMIERARFMQVCRKAIRLAEILHVDLRIDSTGENTASVEFCTDCFHISDSDTQRVFRELLYHSHAFQIHSSRDYIVMQFMYRTNEISL